MLGDQVAVPVLFATQSRMTYIPRSWAADEMRELAHGAERGFDRVIVLDGVGTAQRALSVLLAVHLHGHQPEDHHAKLFQP